MTTKYYKRYTKTRLLSLSPSLSPLYHNQYIILLRSSVSSTSSVRPCFVINYSVSIFLTLLCSLCCCFSSSLSCSVLRWMFAYSYDSKSSRFYYSYNIFWLVFLSSFSTLFSPIWFVCLFTLTIQQDLVLHLNVYEIGTHTTFPTTTDISIMT